MFNYSVFRYFYSFSPIFLKGNKRYIIKNRQVTYNVLYAAWAENWHSRSTRFTATDVALMQHSKAFFFNCLTNILKKYFTSPNLFFVMYHDGC